MSIRLHSLLCLACLAAFASLGITGCRSSSMVAVGASQLTSIPLNVDPMESGEYPDILKLGKDEFVVTRMASKTELRVEKYNRNMQVVWSTPVTIPPPISISIGIISSYKQSSESVLRFLYKDRKLVMISSRRNDDNTSYAVGRLFDVATGALLTERMIDTVPGPEGLDELYHLYRSSISPDTTSIMVFAFGSNIGKSRYSLRVATIGMDLVRRDAKTVDIGDERDVKEFGVLSMTPRGDVFAISTTKPDTIRVARFDAAAGAIGTGSSVALKDVQRLSASIYGTIPFEDRDGNLTLISSARDDEYLKGIGLARFDAQQGRFTINKMYELTEARLKQLIDDDEYEEATGKKAIMTDNPKARYVMIYEHRHVTYKTGSMTNRTYTSNTLGDIVIAAFDENGEPAWQQALRKDFSLSEVPSSLIGTSIQLTDKGNIRIVYREESELRMTDFNLNDGSVVPGSSRSLIEMGAAALALDYFTTWLDDATMIFLIRQGVWSNDWTLQKLEVK